MDGLKLVPAYIDKAFDAPSRFEIYVPIYIYESVSTPLIF